MPTDTVVNGELMKMPITGKTYFKQIWIRGGSCHLVAGVKGMQCRNYHLVLQRYDVTHGSIGTVNIY